MRVPLRQLPAAAFALLCVFAAAADAGGAPRLPLQFVDVLGRVTGPGGRGIEGVRVSLEGAPDVAVLTDADGRYTLTVPIGPLGDPARRNVAARVVARRPGWAFTLRNGQGALAIELRMQTRTDPARCRVRSNLSSPVDALAAAIRRGERGAVVANVDFVGEEGAPPTSRVSLRSEAVTVVGAASAPETPIPAPSRSDEVSPRPVASAGDEARHTAATRADSVRTISAEESKGPPAVLRPGARKAGDRRPQVAADTTTLRTRPTTDRPSSRPRVRRIEAQRAARDTAVPGSIKLPGPGVTQTDASLIRRVESVPGAAELRPARLRAEDVLAEGGDCACRIRGTIEIHPDHLLTRRLDLVVTLREAPAVRDTIQLFMGSPRAFELPPVRCGAWHIEVDAVARRDFTIVSADGRGLVDCREGGLRQLRVVLDPN